MLETERICREIESCIREEFNQKETIPDCEIAERIDAAILEQARHMRIPLKAKLQIREQVYHTIRGYDCLEELLYQEEISEIMVNRYDRIFIEKNGNIQAWQGGFSSEEKYMDVIQQIVAECNRIVNESTPIVDARLKDGSRVNVVLPPIALDGAVLTIRRFPKDTYGMKELIGLDFLSEDIAEFLRLLVKCKYNIMISGGTGSGKTTFLNALTNYIPSDERIITIEDSAELQIRGISNLVRLEVRNANVEGQNAISMKDLIRSSLRMRPDRIIVGEVRGEEAVDMLQAMNTGHNGSLSTGHANSAGDMLYRLETMALTGMEIPLAAIRQQIASALDIIVHIGRLPDGSRKLFEITEVLGIRQGEIQIQTLYRLEDTEGTDHENNQNKKSEWKRLRRLTRDDKLRQGGCLEAYENICHA